MSPDASPRGPGEPPRPVDPREVDLREVAPPAPDPEPASFAALLRASLLVALGGVAAAALAYGIHALYVWLSGGQQD